MSGVFKRHNRAIVAVNVLFLSKIRRKDGRIVTQHSTPKMTPFAITIPKSFPSVKLIKQRAINPATVVMELPTTDEKVLEMAWAIARSSSPGNRFLLSS